MFQERILSVSFALLKCVFFEKPLNARKKEKKKNEMLKHY
jgi:hypothetical protein